MRCLVDFLSTNDVLILNELSHVQREEFASNLLDNADKMPCGVVVIAGNTGFRGTFAWRLCEPAREVKLSIESSGKAVTISLAQE